MAKEIKTMMPRTIHRMMKSTLGREGATYITDTNAHTPDTDYVFYAIKAITETVINAITGEPDIDSATIPISDIIYGDWSSITLTSGTCIAYQTKEDY